MYALVIICLETVEHRQETEVFLFVDKYKEFFNNFISFIMVFSDPLKRRETYLP